MADTVLILGSKPACTVPDRRFDVCYAANGSLMRTPEYAPDARIVSVVSRDYAMAYHPKARADLPKMAQMRCDEVIVIGAFQLQTYAAAFRDFAKDRPIAKRTAWRRTQDVLRALSWPRAKKIADDSGGLVALSWRLALKHELNVWKPSAGFYATLIARERHGPDAEIHVSGIGLSSDGLFNHDQSRGRSHILIDTLLYDGLKRTGVAFHDVDAGIEVPPGLAAPEGHRL